MLAESLILGYPLLVISWGLTVLVMLLLATENQIPKFYTFTGWFIGFMWLTFLILVLNESCVKNVIYGIR